MAKKKIFSNFLVNDSESLMQKEKFWKIIEYYEILRSKESISQVVKIGNHEIKHKGKNMYSFQSLSNVIEIILQEVSSVQK